MTRQQPLHPAFVEALDIDRESLNQRFQFAARRQRIDGPEFLRHLAERVNPVVAAVHELFPERSRAVSSELFDISLDLFGGSILGGESDLPVMDRLWRQLLPGIARFVARDPHRVVGSLCNGLLQIQWQTGHGAENWLKRMLAIAPACASSQQLLDAGKVLGWTCGMAQFRGAALRLARQIDRDLLIDILGLAETTASEDLERLIDQWEHDPWSSPPTDAPPARRLRQVAKIGAFRGFGGPFLFPPTVLATQGRLLVGDTESQWQLHADRFGSYFHRVGEGKLRRQNSKAGKSDPNIATDGIVTWNGGRFPFPQLAGSTTAAFDGVTLAVTLPNSFHIFLLAMVL
jgi:hypothetical protein